MDHDLIVEQLFDRRRCLGRSPSRSVCSSALGVGARYGRMTPGWACPNAGSSPVMAGCSYALGGGIAAPGGQRSPAPGDRPRAETVWASRGRAA